MKIIVGKGSFLALFLAALILLPMFTSCKKSSANGTALSPEDEHYVLVAIEKVKQKWAEEYEESEKNHTYSDKKARIINTRLIKIKENDNESFRDVKAIVEFDVFTNFYGTTPFYANLKLYDTVTFYKDGEAKVLNFIRDYRGRTYKTDYSDMIDEIIELGSAYNDPYDYAELKANEKEYVSDAIEVLKAHWTDFLFQFEDARSDGTLKIVNTRLFLINKNASSRFYESYYKGVKAIVSFELYCDYYGTAPYYENVERYNEVWIMEDNSAKMADKSILQIGAAELSQDFGDLFLETRDFGFACNQTFTLQKQQ